MTSPNRNTALLQKKNYQSPQLMRYGFVGDLTQAGSMSSNEAASNPCPQTDLSMNFNSNCMASDRAVKENIVCIGEHPLGIGLYLFDYKPEYRDAWGHGRQFGVMAQEVETVMPQAVVMHPDGYKMVDYAMLGISRAVH